VVRILRPAVVPDTDLSIKTLSPIAKQEVFALEIEIVESTLS
jgi:hypothetical protein